MKSKILFFMLIGVFLVSSAAMADFVVGTGTAGWQAYVTPDENNQPYWDGNSSDSGSPATVGNFLTNTGFFLNNPTYPSPALVNPQWWGNAMPTSSSDPNTGAADSNMAIQVAGGAGHTVNMLVEVAGNAGSNTFGWYQVGVAGLHQLFKGADSAGKTANFTLNDGFKYGFYLGIGGTIDPNHPDDPPTGQTIFYMNSGLNAADNGLQHFTIFRDTTNAPGSFFIGAEDLLFNGSDLDFNDMVVRLSPDGGGAVPLPPSALLLGSGLLGLLALRRKGRNS